MLSIVNIILLAVVSVMLIFETRRSCKLRAKLAEAMSKGRELNEGVTKEIGRLQDIRNVYWDENR